MQINSYSRFLKAEEDVKKGAERIFTVSDVTQETLGQGEDADKKYVLHFEETERGLALNSTNLNFMLAKFGNDGDSWKGKQITLTAAMVQFGAKMVAGLRIIG